MNNWKEVLMATNTDRPEFQTVPAMDMEEYKGKIRAHRLKILRRTLIVFFLLAVLLAGLWLFMALRHYEDFDVTDSVEQSDTAATTFTEFRGNILKYSNDGALYADADNNRIWNQTYEMANPTIDTCGNYLVVYDKKGTDLYIMTTEGLSTKIETTRKIQMASIAGQGTVAVLMGDQSGSVLVLYDKNGDELVNGAIYGEDGGYPVAIALSDDAVKLAVAMLDISDGNVKTTVAFYNFGSVGENEIDRIVSANSFSDMVIPEMDFVSKDRMVAYGDSEILIFEGTQKPKLTQEIALSDQAKSIFHNEKYIGVVYSNNDEQLTHHVIIYDMHGTAVMEKDFDMEYTQIGFLSNSELCITNEHSCDIYTARGIYKFHYDFDEKLYKIAAGRMGLNYTVILEGVTEKIRLK